MEQAERDKGPCCLLDSPSNYSSRLALPHSPGLQVAVLEECLGALGMERDRAAWPELSPRSPMFRSLLGPHPAGARVTWRSLGSPVAGNEPVCGSDISLLLLLGHSPASCQHWGRLGLLG